MSGDFPDDWFRPGPSPSGSPEPVDDAAHRARQADLDTEPGRWTDQFKPVDRPAHKVPGAQRAPRQQAPRPAATAEPPAAGPTPEGGATAAPRRSHSVGVSPAADVLDERRPRGRGRGVLATTALLALMLGAGVVLGQVWSERRHQVSSPDVVTTPTPAVASTPARLVPWTGAVQAVRPTSVTASCTAPTQTGVDGQPVPSSAERVLDGKLATGWRCDGSGVSQTLSFAFPKGTTVVGVRMTNGYTKTAGGMDLYPQYRRLRTVTWSFPKLDNAYFLQNLADNNPELQEIRIPATSADGGMQMQVTTSTDPGDSGATRDAVVITEVHFLTRKG
ncbi:hypothetical protein [Luteococcus peritonei]|uniref:NAD glycohydrolase translocation F5/8 type C domain-containing protein n=1 Tax=Luteococcus peritonei TaxID=88874 RepID=A0ABW4RXS7_9ACTN